MAMASFSKGKRKPSSRPQRFNRYLNGLQKEFKQQSTSVASPGSSRFDIFLGGLNGEFELMALEIESLQKERDEFKEKVEALMKELEVVRRNLVCERCKEARNPRIAPSSRLKPSGSTPSIRPVVQSKPPHKPTPARVDNPARRPITQNMARKPDPNAVRSPRPLFQTTSQRPPSPGVTRSQPDILPPPSPLTTIDSESCADQHTWTITFNDEVEKELDVEVAHLLSHDDVIMGVNFSPDGKYVAAGGGGGKAYIYTVQTGSLSCVLRNLLPDSEGITKVCFSPDGMYLATGSWCGYIYFWEIKKKHIRNAFKGHDGFIHSLSFSPNGRYLVSTSDDNTVCIWHVRDGAAKYLTEDNPVLLDTPHYRSAIFSPDGRHVAASHRDGMVRLWCVRSRQLVRRVNAYTNWVNDIAFMPEGKGLVSGGRDGTLNYWDISSLATTLRCLDEYGSDTKEHTRPKGGPIQTQRNVVSPAVTPDGRWVVCGMESTIHIWDSRNAATQCILESADDLCVEAIDVSPATRHFASGDDDCTLTIWRY